MVFVPHLPGASFNLDDALNDSYVFETQVASQNFRPARFPTGFTKRTALRAVGRELTQSQAALEVRWELLAS